MESGLSHPMTKNAVCSVSPPAALLSPDAGECPGSHHGRVGMYCGNCGEPVNGKFCASCGAERANQLSATSPSQNQGGLGPAPEVDLVLAQANSAPTIRDTSAVRMAPRFSASFPTIPARFLGSPRLSNPQLGLGCLAWLALVAFVFGLLVGPRLLVYTFYVVGLFLLIARAKRIDARSLLTLLTVGVAYFFVFSVISGPAAAHMLGYPYAGPNWPEAFGAAGGVGLPFFAGALVALVSPRMRADLRTFIRPHPPTADLLRVAVVVLLSILAVFPVGRALTGWVGLSARPTYADVSRQQADTSRQQADTWMSQCISRRLANADPQVRARYGSSWEGLARPTAETMCSYGKSYNSVSDGNFGVGPNE